MFKDSIEKNLESPKNTYALQHVSVLQWACSVDRDMKYTLVLFFHILAEDSEYKMHNYIKQQANQTDP